MFTETITHADGTTGTGTATEAHAMRLLRTAVRRGYRMEATRTGGVIITRDVPTGRSVVPKHHTVALEPAVPVRTLTAAVRGDLEAVAARPNAYLVAEADQLFRARVGRVNAGFVSVPPVTVTRLVDRGLLVVGEAYKDTSNGFLPETRRPVRLSLAARLALVARAHRTRTTEPNGYIKPADIGMTAAAGLNKPGRRAGMVYDASSVAGCSCSAWSRPAGHRVEARSYARGHREQVTKELVAGLV
jgi:hypothetical protein